MLRIGGGGWTRTLKHNTTSLQYNLRNIRAASEWLLIKNLFHFTWYAKADIRKIRCISYPTVFQKVFVCVVLHRYFPISKDIKCQTHFFRCTQNIKFQNFSEEQKLLKGAHIACVGSRKFLGKKNCISEIKIHKCFS